MLGSEPPVLMQEEAVTDDSGCAVLLWTVLAFFCGCLMIAALFSGYELGPLIGKTARFFAPAAAVCGVIHIASCIMRLRIRVIVTPGFVTLVSKQNISAEKTLTIPFSEIKDIQAYHNSLIIITAEKKHTVRQLPGAECFGNQLRTLLREYGVAIPLTEQERYQERIEITKRWKQKHVEQTLTPPQPVQISATADEHGQPILPQRLTDEQTDGVFRPSAQTVRENEEQLYE